MKMSIGFASREIGGGRERERERERAMHYS